MSILKTVHVACHYDFKATCHISNPSCRMSYFRNGCVAVLNLVVLTHYQVKVHSCSTQPFLCLTKCVEAGKYQSEKHALRVSSTELHTHK